MRGTALLLFLISWIAFAPNVVAQSISEIITPQNEAFWSVSVRSPDGNEVEAYQSEKFIVPASNQKLFTTAAVLDRLGADYQYETIIYGSGQLIGGVWYGDLIIRGVGDPSISGFLYGDDREFVFKKWKQQLESFGIRQIQGALIANVGYFDAQVYPPGWDWEDLNFYYGVEISPLSFNNNAVDLTVTANGGVGEIPSISWYPSETKYATFINNQRITEIGSRYQEDYQKKLGQNIFYLGSSMPVGYVEEEALAVSDAALFFLSAFDAFLNKHGIETTKNFEIENEWHSDFEYNLTVLAVHQSQPIGELVAWANKESDNFYTEMLMKTMAAERRFKPASFEDGIDEVRSFLGELNVDTTGVYMKDGSGMASGNLAKTSVFTDFLIKMRSHSDFLAFQKSLSVAGIDGTIAHRMKGTPMYKNFMGKSGYVGGVRTLSGYLTCASGKTIAVSLAANNFVGKVSPIDRIQEQILAYLYAKY